MIVLQTQHRQNMMVTSGETNELSKALYTLRREEGRGGGEGKEGRGEREVVSRVTSVDEARALTSSEIQAS